MDKAPSQAPSEGVYVSGLRLHNASWDSKRALITLLNTSQPHQSSPLPILWLKPATTDNYGLPSEEKGSPVQMHSCPVYSGDVCTEEMHSCTPALRVELPCTLDTTVWTQKRVYVTSTS